MAGLAGSSWAVLALLWFGLAQLCCGLAASIGAAAGCHDALAEVTRRAEIDKCLLVSSESNTGAVVLGRQMGQRRSMIFDDFLFSLNNVLLSVSRSVTFESFM